MKDIVVRQKCLIYILKCVFSMHPHVRPSVGWSVGRVDQSVSVNLSKSPLKGGKLHFHAPISEHLSISQTNLGPPSVGLGLHELVLPLEAVHVLLLLPPALLRRDLIKGKH